MAARAKKAVYISKIQGLLEKYSKIIIFDVTNVGAAQLQMVRQKLRNNSVIVMGKNTLIRRAVRLYAEDGHEEVAAVLPEIIGNVGLIFTEGDLSETKDVVTSFRVPAAAKAGVIAPVDVKIPKGPTGMEPTMTSFLHALNIQSKIAKGQIELIQDVHLIKKGEKVMPGEAALLQKLGVTPFSYGCSVTSVYDSGFVIDPTLLGMTDGDLLGRFALGVAQCAALGMEIGFPNMATVPHSIVKAYQNVLAISIETEYTFEGSKEIKEMIANPDAYVVAAAPVASEAKKEEAAAPPSEEEEESEEMELDLFG